MNELSNILNAKKEPMIGDRNDSSDVSIQWINKNKDLQSLIEGIPLFNFYKNVISLKDPDMEFRVFYIIKFNFFAKFLIFNDI